MSRSAPIPFVLLSLLFALATARLRSAEVMWLQPETFVATPGATVGVQAGFSDAFRGEVRAFSSSRIDVARAELGGAPVAATPWLTAAGRLQSLLTLSRPGVAVIELRLKPEARSISRGEVDRYLNALHASDDVRAAWDAIEAPNPWQEVRTVHLKTYIRVGSPPATDRGWAQRDSDGLDLVPWLDPTGLRTNAELAVRATRDGKPVAGLVVEFLSDGESREHVAVTDASGAASAPLNQRGAWLVRCFDVHRVRATNHDWETATVALVVAVE